MEIQFDQQTALLLLGLKTYNAECLEAELTRRMSELNALKEELDRLRQELALAHNERVTLQATLDRFYAQCSREGDAQKGEEPSNGVRPHALHT